LLVCYRSRYSKGVSFAASASLAGSFKGALFLIARKERMLLNRLTAAGLFLAGLAALVLTMAMNWRFGQGLAIEADSYLSASAYLVIDSMTALSALALGQRVAVKAWTSAAVAGVALVLFGTASMISLIGFGASNRMAIAAAQKAEGEAIAGQHQEALKARLAHADWLRKQSLSTNGADMSKADRKLFIKESTDAVKSVETMSTPKIDPAVDHSRCAGNGVSEPGRRAYGKGAVCTGGFSVGAADRCQGNRDGFCRAVVERQDCGQGRGA
jgi:hypothetical protein